MHRVRQQSSTTHPIPIVMMSGTSAVTGLGTNVTVSLSKDGGAFASAAGAVSELANGFYALAGNATDRNAVGPLLIYATGSGADAYRAEYTITSYDPYTVLPTSTAGSQGGLLLIGANSGTMSLSAAGTLGDIITIAATGAGNANAIKLVGVGAGSGIYATGGASGSGIYAAAGGTSSGVAAIGGSMSGHGIYASGGGTGNGFHGVGGSATGDGMQLQGFAGGRGLHLIGSINGDAMFAEPGALGSLSINGTISGSIGGLSAGAKTDVLNAVTGGPTAIAVDSLGNVTTRD